MSDQDQGPRALGETVTAYVEARADVLRLSTALKRLRANGHSDAAEELSSAAKIDAVCVEHGVLADPIVGFVGFVERQSPTVGVVFACPWCSGSDALARWEEEGRRDPKTMKITPTSKRHAKARHGAKP